MPNKLSSLSHYRLKLFLGKPSKKKLIKSVDLIHKGGGFGPNPHFLKSVDLGGVFLLFLHIFALFGPSWTILVR